MVISLEVPELLYTGHPSINFNKFNVYYKFNKLIITKF
jgi:hypothetical protein